MILKQVQNDKFFRTSPSIEGEQKGEFCPFEMEKQNILFQLLLFVLIVENKEEELGEMKEIFTKENVILVGKILFPFIHLISLTKFMLKKFGGLINGMDLIMVVILIFLRVFLANLMHYSNKFHSLI